MRHLFHLVCLASLFFVGGLAGAAFSARAAQQQQTARPTPATTQAQAHVHPTPMRVVLSPQMMIAGTSRLEDELRAGAAAAHAHPVHARLAAGGGHGAPRGGPAGGQAVLAAYCAPVHNRFVSWAYLAQDGRNMVADLRVGTPRARADAAWEARVAACLLLRHGYVR